MGFFGHSDYESPEARPASPAPARVRGTHAGIRWCTLVSHVHTRSRTSRP